MKPAGDHFPEDFYRAGGVEALMKQLLGRGLLNGDALTVTGGTVAENVARSEVRDGEVIRPLDNPYRATGGIAFLYGNLAPDGAVCKKAAVVPEMLRHQGRRGCSTGRKEDAVRAILSGGIRPGDVVIRRVARRPGNAGDAHRLRPSSAWA